MRLVRVWLRFSLFSSFFFPCFSFFFSFFLFLVFLLRFEMTVSRAFGVYVQYPRKTLVKGNTCTLPKG